MGLHIAADLGRVVALLQRLPCQKTKPKGLRCGGELLRFDLYCACYKRKYMVNNCTPKSGFFPRLFNPQIP